MALQMYTGIRSPLLQLFLLSFLCSLNEGRGRPLVPIGRRPRRRDQQPLISKRKEVHGSLSCNSHEANGTVCIIDQSVETDDDLDLEFKGDVVFQSNITVTSKNGLMNLKADGKVSVGNQVTLAIHGDLTITARQISAEKGSTFESQGVLFFTAGEDSSQDANGTRRLSEEAEAGFYLNGLINCSRISLHHRTGIVQLHEGKYLANGKSSKGGLQVVSRDMRIRKPVTVQASQVILEADGFIYFEPDRIAGNSVGLATSTSDPPLDFFQAYAGGHLHVGGGTWSTNSFTAAAQGTINIAAGTLKTTGTIATNHQSKRISRCDDLQKSFPTRTSKAGEAAALVKKIASDSDLTFDFVVASKSGSITFEDKARLFSASMFVCAATKIVISDEVLVDSSNRGCGPDNGSGKGLWNASTSCSGGGSNFGAGGSGAQFYSTGAEPCADAGKKQEYDDKFLPTQSASGGACSGSPLGFGTSACPAQEPFYSYGGGLIWMSCKSLEFNQNVMIRADGKQGKLIGDSGSYVSGGGSGGQILMWASDLLTNDKPTLSVQGGDATCTTSLAAGAGGGGFVGMGLKSQHAASAEQIDVKRNGGEITEDCKKLRIPELAKVIVKGDDGIAASLLPCPPGHSGLFCDACPIGTWNSDGGLQCIDCTNKPRKSAEYTKVGETVKFCEYRCVNGVPSVFGNRECLNIPEFILHFFGGRVGLLFILLTFVVIIALLLLRRSCISKRMIQSAQAGRSFNQPGAFHGMLGKSSPLLDDRRMLRFSKEQLPYHICRVFLIGSNTTTRAWALDGEIPQLLEPLIMNEYWSRFVSEVANRTVVPRKQRWVEKFLEYCYPPAAPLYALKCRRKRVIAVQECVHAFSEGTGTRDAVWKPLRVRFDNPVNKGTSVLGMAFGCDYGATLGYIDFFDFNRSQLDFAPIDLRQEVRIMAAHGDGSYLEPYALDPADPLLQHLGQMGCGIAAVYSVVAAFNWNARRVRNTDLFSSSSTALEDLKKGVEDCAARCGLGGLVQVIVSRQQRAATRGCRGRAAPRGIAPLETSFSDLCRGGSAFDGRISPLSGSSADMSLSIALKNQDLKLCLAFADCDVAAYTDMTLDTKAGYATNASLTSPMPRPVFGQYLAATKSSSLEELRKLPFWRRWAQWAASMALNARVSAQNDDGVASPATVVLVILIFLLFVDLMLFILMGYLVSQYSIPIFLSWLIIPPLAGPLAIALGPVIVLTEDARLARMYVLTLLFSVSSTLLVLVILIFANQDSWIFHVVECLTVIAIKAILVLCANAHIASLESAQDLSFVGSLQVDAASGMILSGEPSSTFGHDDSGVGTLERLQRAERGASKGSRPPSAPSDSGFDWDETRYVSDDSAPSQLSGWREGFDRQANYTTLSDMAKTKGNSRDFKLTESEKANNGRMLTSMRSTSASPF